MKTVTIPAVTEALGLIKKGFQKHLERVPATPNLGETQKLVLTGLIFKKCYICFCVVSYLVILSMYILKKEMNQKIINAPYFLIFTFFNLLIHIYFIYSVYS